MSVFESSFANLRQWIQTLALPEHQFLMLHFDADQSDYVRFNRGKIRQAGRIQTLKLVLVLVERRSDGSAAQVQYQFSATTNAGVDLRLCAEALVRLQALVAEAGPDPLLLFNEAPSSSEQNLKADLPEIDVMVDTIENAMHEGGTKGQVDLVGFLALGPRACGLLSTLGHSLYQARRSYFFDFSIYAGDLSFPKPPEIRDKAVKQSIADTQWDPERLTSLIRNSVQQAQVLLKPAKRLTPGHYRAWLAPAAVADLLEMMSWGGFSLSSLRRGNSPLERAYGGMNAVQLNLMPGTAPQAKQDCPKFSPLFTLSDCPSQAGVPRFQGEGFVAPESTALIQNGIPAQLLVSPRGAQEFSVPHNGYGPAESPLAIKLFPGALDEARAMQALGTGLYISNLWYLNFSDRVNCGVTGMTRFASLWVENGVPVAPLSAMRIDDSLYQVFGEQLEALGNVSHAIPNVSTYDQRAFGATYAPGALIKALRLTL
jgi:predicted Zn-dependent protease